MKYKKAEWSRQPKDVEEYLYQIKHGKQDLETNQSTNNPDKERSHSYQISF